MAREFGDEGENWIRALAPFAFGGGGNATKVAIDKFYGGALVSKASWMVGVVVALVALTAGGWYLLGGGHPSDGDAVGEPCAVALPLVATHDAGEEEVAAQKLAVISDEEPARIAFEAEGSLSGPVYVLVDPEAHSVQDAKLLVCRDGAVLSRGATDDEGRFTTGLEEEGAAQLLVLAPGWPPQVHEVFLAPAIYVVTLRAGASVSGWIVVDGGLPTERIPLSLHAEHGFLDIEERLGATAKELEIGGRTANSTRTRAGEDGSFRFDGLAADWMGSLKLPSDYRLTNPALVEYDFRPSSMVLDRPTVQLRIDVEKRLALTGRVVEFREGEPIPLPEAMVSAEIQYARTGPASTEEMELTGADGRFRIPLEIASVRGGRLYLTSPDRKLRRRVELEPQEVQGDWNVGDVPLVDPETTCTVQLVVLDPAGSPIFGAVAGVDDFSPSSDPTSVGGRTELRGVVPGTSTIVVYAVGYQVSTVSVPLEVQQEITVTMHQGAVLELHFVTPDGEPTKGLRVSLMASRHPLRKATQRPASSQAYLTAGCRPYLWSRIDDSTEMLHMSAPREGRLIVNDVEPGLALHLRVEGRFGGLVQEHDIAPLRPEERRSIDIVLAQGSRVLRGRVLDEAGHPIPRASVEVTRSPSGGRQGYSQITSTGVEADGSFAIRDVYTPTLNLEITADGYASLSREDYELPANDTPVEFRLARGHEVMVRVADALGRPVLARVWAERLRETQTHYVWSAETEFGAHLLRDLPEEDVRVHARVHGVSYFRLHDPRIPELRIEVPTLGALEATLGIPSDLELDKWCHLWLLPQDDSEIVPRYALIDSAGTGAASLPDVLPGSYQAVLRRWRYGEVEPEGWYEEFSADQFMELSPRVPTVIRADETTRIDVWP